MHQSVKKYTARLLSETNAGTSMLVAAVILPLAMLSGFGLDMGRQYQTQATLQDACDAGVLAGRVSVFTGGLNENAKYYAKRAFFNNMEEKNEDNWKGTEFDTSTPDDGINVRGDASTTFKPIFPVIYGSENVKLSASCQATMDMNNLDIAIAIDATDSMAADLDGNTRLFVLKQGLRELRESLYKASNATSTRVRYAFVPFSSTVNVGTLLDEKYISDKLTLPTELTPITNIGNGTLNSVYKDHTYDVGKYIKGEVWKQLGTYGFLTPDGKELFVTWEGCVVEPKTVASDSIEFDTSTMDINEGHAYDLKIGHIPGNDLQKWKAYVPEFYYLRYDTNGEITSNTSSVGKKADTACAPKAKTLTTLTKDELNTYLETITLSHGTYLDLGMVWAGRMLAGQGVFADIANEAPTNDKAVEKHVMLFTDGQMSTFPEMATGYGIEAIEGRVGSSDKDELNELHASRFTAVCEDLKARGMRVWVIAQGKNAPDYLENCASEDSFLETKTRDDVEQAFKTMAKQVTKVRLTVPT